MGAVLLSVSVIAMDYTEALAFFLTPSLDFISSLAAALVVVEEAQWLGSVLTLVGLLTCFRGGRLTVISPYIRREGGEGVEEEKRREEKAALQRTLTAIPALSYHRGMRCDPLCAICFADMEEGERVRIFSCRHGFHAECIDAWLVRRRTCPLCVSVVRLPGGRAEVELVVRGA